jgi:hypothetical protein
MAATRTPQKAAPITLVFAWHDLNEMNKAVAKGQN